MDYTGSLILQFCLSERSDFISVIYFFPTYKQHKKTKLIKILYEQCIHKDMPRHLQKQFPSADPERKIYCYKVFKHTSCTVFVKGLESLILIYLLTATLLLKYALQ